MTLTISQLPDNERKLFNILFGKKKLNEGPMTDIKWSQKEKSVSRAAFEKALKNEYDNIIGTVKKKATNLSESKNIWELEDYLCNKRKEIDNKYDYRYSALIVVFGR